MATPFISPWQRDNFQNMEFYPGFFDQVRLQHEHSSKLWALLQSGSCGPYDVSEESSPDSDWIGDSFQGTSWRKPTSNEIKLEAWLAVAGDADGIMWYWGTPSGVFNPNLGKYQPIGGLFDWDSQSNFCDSGGASLNRTNRDTAAGQVHAEILRISPILESLKFVKTCASRAFERNYPDSTHKATWLDTLATNTSWYEGRTYRSVEAILAFPPTDSGWSQTAESHPYVQVSRFRNQVLDTADATLDDYWFLVVNRRALEEERRKIRLVIEVDSAHISHPYYVDYILGDSTRIAAPCQQKIPACAVRLIDVVLEPGEGQLMHLYRGEFGCDTTLAHIDSLIIAQDGPNAIRLTWEGIEETDLGEPFQVENYYVCGSPLCNGPYTPVACDTVTTFVDSVFFPAYHRYFYQVQACGHVQYRSQSAPKPTPHLSKKR